MTLANSPHLGSECQGFTKKSIWGFSLDFKEPSWSQKDHQLSLWKVVCGPWIQPCLTLASGLTVWSFSEL